MNDTATQPWSADELVEQLRTVGREAYHDKHPFHCLMNGGRLDRDQLRCWVRNRYYYQKNIPIKDALLLARCPLRDVRRRWLQRIIDHDGTPGHSADGSPPGAPADRADTGQPGGIEKWLRLGEAMEVSRQEMESESHLLPGVRFAVDAYLQFVATRPWIEGVASSLTELFAPDLMQRRLAAFEEHYGWIAPEGLAYFRSRPPLARRDSDHALSLVLQHCRTRSEQQAAVDALRFKCELLWAQLDAIYTACVLPTRGQSP